MLTFNYQHGTQTVSLAEIEAFLGSDLDGSSPPNKNAARRAVFLFGENSEAEKARDKLVGLRFLPIAKQKTYKKKSLHIIQSTSFCICAIIKERHTAYDSKSAACFYYHV